jgi:hypothetical protein
MYLATTPTMWRPTRRTARRPAGLGLRAMSTRSRRLARSAAVLHLRNSCEGSVMRTRDGRGLQRLASVCCEGTSCEV